MTDRIYDYRPFSPCGHIVFKNRTHVSVPYLNDDNPIHAYSTHDLCFVAQPLYGPEVNKNHNVVTIPLMMTDEWPLIQRTASTIDLWRGDKIGLWKGVDKIYDYNFLGQCGYAGRSVFRDLDLDNYLFEDTKTVYNLKGEKKEMALLNFLTNIAESRFVFAPRGVGSSSFRAYQTMMVGSVPIITGMNDYPFEDEVDWDTFSIRGELKDLDQLIEKSQKMSVDEYEQMRSNAINFWDNYCRHDKLYERLQDIYRNHNNEDWGLGAD